jgi:hypothetical protein
MKRKLKKRFRGSKLPAISQARESRRKFRMTKSSTRLFSIIAMLAIAATGVLSVPPLRAQAPTGAYQPKFHGDPAHSDSEAAALAYMRVVIRAQHHFNKQYGHYATSLAELVHSGTFTKRMVNPDRGDYTAGFKGKKDSFILTMTPQHLDPDHRSFYAEDDGKIHADEEKPASADSLIVK